MVRLGHIGLLTVIVIRIATLEMFYALGGTLSLYLDMQGCLQATVVRYVKEKNKPQDPLIKLTG